MQVDDAAEQVVHSCLETLQSLVESLLQGHVALGHLQTCLKYKEQFKRLHQQCMNINKHYHHKQPSVITTGSQVKLN